MTASERDRVERLRASGAVFEAYRTRPWSVGVYRRPRGSAPYWQPISDHATEADAEQAATALNGREVPKRVTAPIVTTWRTTDGLAPAAA